MARTGEGNALEFSRMVWMSSTRFGRTITRGRVTTVPSQLRTTATFAFMLASPGLAPAKNVRLPRGLRTASVFPTQRMNSPRPRGLRERYGQREEGVNETAAGGESGFTGNPAVVGPCVP